MFRRIAALAVACLLCTVASPVLAHDGAEDIGWVYLSGNSQANGQATVRVDASELATCDQLRPLRLEGVRAELDVNGTLTQVEDCRYEGVIALPEAGRWMVAARFAYEGREAEVWMPVGVTDAPQEFERGDWLHAVGEGSFWGRVPTYVVALVGLVIGGLLTLAYRWWQRARGGRLVT